ncbi:MAG TPA: TonB-dependent siderophore receptor [Vibrio sp.]|uniref:TonB-dependent siderophore receptor n=1 Tax=Vibrio TaxID=662 RepID=UPI000EE3120F|nr:MULTISPECIES: TonB-dependent siderophore receptor [Vibrio]HCH02760.1 TonB-dependent siderophore receptor [Vibrio sp.]
MDDSKGNKFSLNLQSCIKLALYGCVSTLMLPVLANAQEDTDKLEQSKQEAHRVNTVTVFGQALDDDSETIVAKELWVGGKVATSILDTPASVSVITEKEISQRDASTTEEVLQYSPGLVTDYYGSDDRNDYFQIRGYQATTYRDGMTLGSMRGVREDPYAYERVEVIRGANSTLFGPADPGGSVNFVSKRPKFESFGNGYVSYGSFDHKEMGVDVGDTLNEDETLAFRFTGKMKDSELEYDTSHDDSQFFMGGLTWEPSAFTTATLIVDYLNRDSTPNSGGYPMDKEYDRSNFYGEPDFNYHNVERTNVTAQMTHDFNNGFTLRANARYSHLTDDYGYTYLNAVGVIGTDIPRAYLASNSSADQFIGNTILQYDVSFNRIDSSTVVGLEYSNSSTQDESFYAATTSIDIANPVYSGAPTLGLPYQANDQDNQSIAAFVQQNFSLDDRYILTFGIRQDYIDMSNRDMNAVHTEDDFSETSYRGALTYKITPQVSTYVSYVESVAPPTIGVQPERGRQSEVGIKYAPQDINALFTASVYQLEKKDITISVTDSMTGNITRQTIGKSRVRGLDLEARAELFNDFDLIAGYSYMESEVLKGVIYGSDVTGNEFSVTPNNTASLWGNYSMLNDSLSIGLGARYVGSYYFDAQNTEKSEAATLFDGALSYQFAKSTGLSFNIHNIADKQYVVGSGTSDYYNPGRSFTVNLHHEW